MFRSRHNTTVDHIRYVTGTDRFQSLSGHLALCLPDIIEEKVYSEAFAAATLMAKPPRRPALRAFINSGNVGSAQSHSKSVLPLDVAMIYAFKSLIYAFKSFSIYLSTAG